jgi:pteridine reductase
MNSKRKVALVTGGARRVGKAIAIALAQFGMDVVVHYGSSIEEAKNTVNEIMSFGPDALAVQANLSHPIEIQHLFDTVISKFGRLDVLINSASTFQKKQFMDIEVDDWNYVMDVNLRAPFLCSQLAAKLMLKKDGGVIINIADTIGLRPRQELPHHCISKAGVIMLTQVTALALGPRIRVNAIAPGPILPSKSSEPQVWDNFRAALPLKRTGSPENITRAIIFLIQDDFMTGQTLTIDGGETLIEPY